MNNFAGKVAVITGGTRVWVLLSLVSWPKMVPAASSSVVETERTSRRRRDYEPYGSPVTFVRADLFGRRLSRGDRQSR